MKVVNFKIMSEAFIVRFNFSLTKRNGGKQVFATFNTHRAGFTYLITMYRQTRSVRIMNMLKINFRAIQKRGAREAQSGIGQMHNTILPLPREVYKFLLFQILKGIQNALQKDPRGFVFAHFAHLFLTLSWNTMYRTSNTAHILLNHLAWSGDSLQIFVLQVINDQEGGNADIPKNVFANPVNPEISPILALGLIFSVTDIQPAYTRIFVGSNQADSSPNSAPRVWYCGYFGRPQESWIGQGEDGNKFDKKTWSNSLHWRKVSQWSKFAGAGLKDKFRMFINTFGGPEINLSAEQYMAFKDYL